MVTGTSRNTRTLHVTNYTPVTRGFVSIPTPHTAASWGRFSSASWAPFADYDESNITRVNDRGVNSAVFKRILYNRVAGAGIVGQNKAENKTGHRSQHPVAPTCVLPRSAGQSARPFSERVARYPGPTSSRAP